ncbi:MAG TPA: hypothetical protein VMS86_03415 [Thermoanaerobaculia bacterium]|nr:hypothetical protein [Thermoanaerobaculia bacterium]
MTRETRPEPPVGGGATSVRGPGREALLAAARRLEPHHVHLFFKHGAHFHNPLVPAEWEALAQEPALDQPAVQRVVVELLPARLPGLAPGIYSPVPIARGLEAGRELDALLDELRYEMIRVDEEQRWTWMGRAVAPRIKAFFLERLAWEPALGIWYFEYQVNPEWWDKSYLDAAITPLVASSAVEEAGSLRVTLNAGGSDLLDLDTLRLDQRERLFCGTMSHGEVLFADALRFTILRHANEACDAVRIAGRWRPLRYAAPPR